MRVVDSRPYQHTTRRRHVCWLLNCGHRWNTIEVSEAEYAKMGFRSDLDLEDYARRVLALHDVTGKMAAEIAGISVQGLRQRLKKKKT